MSNRQDPRLYVAYGHQRGLTEMEALQELVDKQGVDPTSHQWCKIFKENGWNFEHAGYAHTERADYVGQLAYEPSRDYVPHDEPRGMSESAIQENQIRYNASRTWKLMHKHASRIEEDNTVDAEWEYADERLPEGMPQLPSGQNDTLPLGIEQTLLYEIERAEAEWRWDDYNRLVQEYCGDRK